jgi:hypothetical protein
MTKITLTAKNNADIVQRLKNNYHPAEIANELIRDLYYLAPIYPAPQKIKAISAWIWIAFLSVFSVILLGLTAAAFDRQNSSAIILFLLLVLSLYTLVKLLITQKKRDLQQQSKSYCGLTKDAIILIEDKALTVKNIMLAPNTERYQLQPPTFINLESCTVIRTEDSGLAIYTNKVEPIRLYFAPEDQPIFKKYLLHLIAANNYEILDADK